MDDARVTKVGFGAVLAVAEFRAMWLAELLSICGDQLARVALAVLVYQRTSSAALTGLTYALTYVPSLLGGILLAGAGDRWPRRDVMVAADVARAALVGVIAIPGVPLWVLCVLVAVMTALGGPFKAAQQALLPTVLEGERYLVGMALRNVTIQGAQLAGFAGGGLLIAALAPSAALALDAVTFALSALFLVTGVRRRAAIAQAVRPAWLSTTGAGIRLIWRDPALRTLVALNWLAGFYVVPEALAAPYAAGIGAGATLVGLLMAADPAGSVLGGVLFGKWIPERAQVRVLGWLGIAAGLPLVVFVFRPGLVASVLLLAASGLLATGYNITGTVTFMRRVPDEHRAQCAGVNSAGLITVQGVGAAAAGVLADVLSPAHTIAVAGAAGAAVAVPIARAWRRVGLEGP
ncbi:Predicted arabinose efflux permease, MFS family [Amycolatopsis pretoriensis]|uniref:Predicted arabinose efflux permease, MFS family n=1 Tax=Amycolatopsis pretoriensis TaxID=218821 RepID=A0A1H5RGD4_9PSEU|nr:MFS transporter [Amycolatopsis pretoriensis]SEF36541.1 Predicted arabinose efflux permease, MFS family [Amycolatopsis pretoriensis]